MSAPTLPTDVVNRALDECGVDPIGDLNDGSPAANAALRIYDPMLREMLSAAHWNFARKQDFMTLNGDRSGISNANTSVPLPWNYMYEWPTDCVNARFVPATDITAVGQVSNIAWNSPSPFLISFRNIPNTIASEWWLKEGRDPEHTRVILSNQLGAELVYTAIMQYPDGWDPLFLQAMVAGLAARLAMPVIPDKKYARVVRADNMQMARMALDAARVRDGNEGWTVQNHTPDWIRARTGYGGGWDGPGIFWNGWSNVSWLEDAGGVF